MSSQATTIINVDTIAELVNFVTSKPIMFCLENKKLYGWNGNVPEIANVGDAVNATSKFQRVTWRNKVNVTEGSSGYLTKTSPDAWDGGAFSNEGIITGILRYVPIITNVFRVIGISKTDTDQNFTSIFYGFFFNGGATFNILVKGVFYQSSSAFSQYDTLDITVDKIEDNTRVVKFWKNGVFLLATVDSGDDEALFYADVSLNGNSTTTGAPFMLRYT